MTTQSHNPDDDLSYYETELPKVIAGVRRGEKWEYSVDNKTWKEHTEYQAFSSIVVYGYRVRLAPVPVVKWWSEPADVPGPICWIRGPQVTGERMITHTIGNTIHTASGISFNLERQGQTGYYQIEGHEYSVDRIHWSPCVKPEGGK